MLLYFFLNFMKFEASSSVNFIYFPELFTKKLWNVGKFKLSAFSITSEILSSRRICKPTFFNLSSVQFLFLVDLDLHIDRSNHRELFLSYSTLFHFGLQISDLIQVLC